MLVCVVEMLQMHYGDFKKAFEPPLGGAQMLSYSCKYGKTDLI